MPHAADRTDVVIVHEADDAWAENLAYRLRDAGAGVAARTAATTPARGFPDDLLELIRTAKVVVMGPGLSEAWMGMLAGIRAAVGLGPPVAVRGKAADRVSALPGIGPTGAIEVVEAMNLLEGICHRLGLTLTDPVTFGALPRRARPIEGTPWHGRIIGLGACTRQAVAAPGRPVTCRHADPGRCERHRAMLAAVSEDDATLVATFQANHPRGWNLPEGRNGWEAAMAVRGITFQGILPRATSARIAAMMTAREESRGARVQRLTNFRIGVEEEGESWIGVLEKIWTNPDLGALFAGDPLMPDPCNETIAWTQLGTAAFWLSALQHRTLPDLLGYLKNPDIIPGRAWSQRLPRQGKSRPARVDDTLIQVIELYPPRSEAEVLSWIELVQQRLPVRMVHSIRFGIQGWPGIDRRLIRALAHYIGDEDIRQWDNDLDRREWNAQWPNEARPASTEQVRGLS